MKIQDLVVKLKEIDNHLKLTFSNNENEPIKVIYALNVIDYATFYSFKKDEYDFDEMVNEISDNKKLNKLIQLINQYHDEELPSQNVKTHNNPFKRFTDKLAATLKSKNDAYGDSFSKSVDAYGLSVIGVRLSDKYNRIEHLIANNELQENDESLKDTLLDNAGYSILALKYLKEHNDD